MDKIKEFVRRHTEGNKTIEFVHKVEPSRLSGGFILQIGSRQLDASLMKS